MADGISLKDLTGISEPATRLIEKVSDAIGGLAAPWQMRRLAQAEADAQQIKALGQIRSDITLRALDRFLREEAKKQQNMETIGAASIEHLAPDSTPEKMDNDWVVNFFDKCRLISDSEMQQLWAKVLAGESNTPGRFSKRTVNYLGSLDKTDAMLFTSLCSFDWYFPEKNSLVPVIFDFQHPIYQNQGITFDNLMHLDEIGLVSFDAAFGYLENDLPSCFVLNYQGKPYQFEFLKPGQDLDIGKVLLSKVGQELSPICPCNPLPQFIDYAVQKWTTDGLVVTELKSS